MDEEIRFSECGRPCVLIVDLEYMGLLRKFVVPLRSNISSKTPGNQYFPLPPNGNTRDGNHHGVHYIKLFPIEKQYVDRYRINGGFYGMIAAILSENESKIVSDCQKYLKECENGNKHFMTPDIDGIIGVLENI